MRGDTAYDALDDAGYTMEQPYRSTGRVKWAAWKLLSLFTQILDRTERAEYRHEAPGDYSAVTEAALAGIWVDDASTHRSAVFRGRLSHRVSGTGVAWRNRPSTPSASGTAAAWDTVGVGHRLSAKWVLFRLFTTCPASTIPTSGATPRINASADWSKRGAENRPYQKMCPCGRGRFFCVIFHTYKLTQPSLAPPGDGCVVINLKWIYLLLRPPRLLAGDIPVQVVVPLRGGEKLLGACPQRPDRRRGWCPLPGWACREAAAGRDRCRTGLGFRWAGRSGAGSAFLMERSSFPSLITRSFTLTLLPPAKSHVRR